MSGLNDEMEEVPFSVINSKDRASLGKVRSSGLGIDSQMSQSGIQSEPPSTVIM